MVKLTPKQQQIYDYILSFTSQHGYPPSVREIGEAVGLRSPSTVHFHLKHMEELGVIGKGAGKGRALTLAQPMRRQVPTQSLPVSPPPTMTTSNEAFIGVPSRPRSPSRP